MISPPQMLGALAAHGGAVAHEQRIDAAAAIDEAFQRAEVALVQLAAELHAKANAHAATAPAACIDFTVGAAHLEKLAHEADAARALLRGRASWGAS